MINDYGNSRIYLDLLVHHESNQAGALGPWEVASPGYREVN